MAVKTKNSVEDERSIGAILEHIARYRLTNFAALCRLPILKTTSPRSVRSLLHKAKRETLIQSAPLHHATRYWYLTAEGATRAGLTEIRCGPLSEAAKLRAYATLRYCCLAERSRHRLTAEELKRSFPALYRPGLPSNYYFDAAGSGRIGLLRIDGGGRGRWDRALQSLRQDVSRHALHDGFRQLVAVGRFQITLVTTLPQKAARLRSALQTFADAQRVPIEIVSMPDLLPLITPCHRKETPARRTR